jgi:hypothetical protein
MDAGRLSRLPESFSALPEATGFDFGWLQSGRRRSLLLLLLLLLLSKFRVSLRISRLRPNHRRRR